MVVHLALLFVLTFLNYIFRKRRIKKIFLVSFLVVFVYWAIRYDYGLDYWNYYDYFNRDIDEWKHGLGEILFFRGILPLFEKYYQLIIFSSGVIAFTLYYMVKKNVPPKTYWIFFLFFFSVHSFHFNLISTMRSSLAACVLIWGYYLGYFMGKDRHVLYLLFLIAAGLIHSSAFVFIIVPIYFKLFSHMRGNLIFISLCVASIFSLFLSQFFFQYLVSTSDLIAEYDQASENVNESNLIGFTLRSVILIPSYYICKLYNNAKSPNIKYACLLTFLYLYIKLLGLDINGRFTAYLYLFFIIALCYSYVLGKKSEKFIILVPYLCTVWFELYRHYVTMFMLRFSVWQDGNTFLYKTIFDVWPKLP